MTRILKGCTWVEVPSPVPPVVPDSEALADHIPASMPQDGLHWYRRWLVAQQQLDAKFQREVSSGSGVVPDKPALAPEPCKIGADFPEHHHHASSADIVVICTRPEVKCHHVGVPLIPCPDASVVPAVTDDEAATKVRAVALALAAVDGYDTYARQANEFITRLRSAGFLIVHHTKET